MTERTLKYRSGLLLIVGHLVVLVAVIVLRLFGGYSGEEFTTIFAVIVPMFSGYSTAIIGFIVKDRYTRADRSKEVTGSFAALSFVFPILFTTAVLAAVLLQAFNAAFENFEDFKRFLLAIETAFAVYVGRFVYSMFEKQEEQKASVGSPKDR
jgi:hypothetical protein